MLQEHLNRLALLYVHQDIDCPPEMVVDTFAQGDFA